MSIATSNAQALHAQALIDLDAGRPLAALKAWRKLLQIDHVAVEDHLQAAVQLLSSDQIAPLRQQAISLASDLVCSEPGETEINRLGAVLRGWGSLALPEVPSRALQHLERAWSCGRDSRLDKQLAELHARLGYLSGSNWLASLPAELEPWPFIPCAGQYCRPCQQKPAPPGLELKLNLIENGRIWVQRQRNPWHHSHGVAVVDQSNAFQPLLCRHYPWPWPACPHQKVFEQVAQLQLKSAEKDLSAPDQVEGPVLALAELSGEMFFHWQLELLPRLGRIWKVALQRWPSLRLWHNGGGSAYVLDGLSRLGIGPERLLPASDHLKAELLIVPDFIPPYGQPCKANLDWLEQFWGWPTTHRSEKSSEQSLWLGRNAALHRPVLGERSWINQLQTHVLHRGKVQEQLKQVAAARILIAPHGAAMSNLLSANPDSMVIEIVNPAYKPNYFDSLITNRGLKHLRYESRPTPLPLQEWLYEGPLAYPIDLRPGGSNASETLAGLSI